MARHLEDDSTLDRDPGLQPERTSLAWARTTLGYLVVATVSLKAAPHNGTAGVVSALAYLGLAIAVALRRTPRYGRDLRHMHTGRTTPPILDVLALGAATAALALHCLWLAQ